MKVFVYGTLKRGFGNHRLLSSATYVGPAVLDGSHVLLDAGFPVCVPLYTGLSCVTGEVYEVSPETMRRLDLLEGEGRMYHRVKRKVRYNTIDGGTGNAWVYIGDRNFWRNHANVGSQWVQKGFFFYDGNRAETRNVNTILEAASYDYN